MQEQGLNERNGQIIREKREKLGIELEVLAKEVSLAMSATRMAIWLKDIEEGKRLPSWRLAKALSSRLDIPPSSMRDWLLTNESYAGPDTNVSNFSKPDNAYRLLYLHMTASEIAPFIDFGEFITFYAMRSGFDLSDIQSRVDVGKEYLTKIILGQRLLDMKQALTLAACLGIQREDILNRLSEYVDEELEAAAMKPVEGLEELEESVCPKPLADRLLKHLSGPAGPYIKKFMDLIETKSTDQRAKIPAVFEKMLTALNQIKEDEKK